MRKLLIGLLAIVLMGISIYGYLYFMKQTEIKRMTMTTIKPVRLLQSGDVIESSMLRKVDIPTDGHSSEALTDIQALIGKTVTVPVGQNEEILSWKIRDQKTVPGDGERYYSFKSDPITNVNNMIRKGDRVDVWVEFDQPKIVKGLDGSVQSIGSVKIIEGLPVAGIKTVDGLEVTENGAIQAVVQSDESQINNSRGKASGIPDKNTYIMTDESYEAYTLGGLGGHIKLALPNMTNPMTESAKVTDIFKQLKMADAFTKSKPQVNVTGTVNQSDVRTSGAEQNNAKQSSAASVVTPNPTAAEVKR